MNKLVVLYDEMCYLCQQSKRIFRFLDWLRVLDWVSLQAYEKVHPLSEGQKDTLRGELHVNLPNGKVLVGFYAVRAIMIWCPVISLFGVILYLPKADVWGVPLYRWIAKNRYRLFKQKCINGSCRIHKH
jgi:predicted DCC family thiol-disulfide oxidoreductase YuxK